MEVRRSFTITLENRGDYRFAVDFGRHAFEGLLLDEPPPLGDSSGPNAAQVLTAAVANCLSASLLFCLKKARVEPNTLTATAETMLSRNEKGRLRIERIDVSIQPELSAVDSARIGRCVDLFENFCMVTESVREGIEVNVQVEPVNLREEVPTDAEVLG